MNHKDLYVNPWGAVIQSNWGPQAPPARRSFALHFRTYGDRWKVAISRDPAIPAHELLDDCPLAVGWVCAGRYGTPGGYDANLMPEEASRRIMQECATQYLLLLRQAGLLDD